MVYDLEKITTGFSLWDCEKEKIALFFRNRDKKAALDPMKKYIANFLDILFMINNERAVHGSGLLEQIEKLEVKPINSKERLAFLLERPDHYHSYIQLTELYEELEKQFKKKVAIEQKKTRNA